jgi:hypothetical protein
MSIENRLKKVEAVSSSRAASGELHGITLDQWRRLRAGEDVLPEIPESRRAAFFQSQTRADERRRQAAETVKMFEL